jgi:hypothetical protein
VEVVVAETNSDTAISTTSLILLPSLITIGVTIMRLVGELHHWSNPWGGRSSILSIAWLPCIFGPYFALKLARSGQGPAVVAKAVGLALLGLVVMPIGSTIAFAPQVKLPGKLAVGCVLMLAAVTFQWIDWSALAKTLVAYGCAARIPVALVMFYALRGNWGTYYDRTPPGFPPSASFWTKYVHLAVLRQLVWGVVWTVVVGSVFGTVVAALARRGKAAARTTS